VEYRPTHVRVTEVQFTRKWIKVFSALSFTSFLAGGFLLFYCQEIFLGTEETQKGIGALLLLGGLVGSILASIVRWWHHD
jgi:hypothetical protein